jgi:hypothetical protein
MRLFCWYCHKSVSSELPDNAIFRAIAVCPECIARSDEAAQLQLAVELETNIYHDTISQP